MQITIRLTEELHAKLRWLSYLQRRSQHAIALEYIEQGLAGVEVPVEAREKEERDEAR